MSDDDWVKVINTGVDFVIDSDAHSPSNVGKVDFALDIVKRLEIPLSRIKNIDGQVSEMRFTEFKNKM